jgi:hypothetical protein
MISVQYEEGIEMKKVISLVIFASCVAAPSFAAEHVLSHSAEVMAKYSYRAVMPPVKDTGKATAAVVKFVF